MTIDFALFLSLDGIALAHRQPAGHWALIGEARPDADDLDSAMADLKAQGVERAGGAFKTLLVLPDDQVLYTSFTVQTSDPAATRARILEGLDGATPYAVDDLVYDWRAVAADRVKVAVIAQETLDEARGFAETYGFTALGFSAMPPEEKFPGMPAFDGSDSAPLDLPVAGLRLGSDDWATARDAAAEAEIPASTEDEDEDEDKASTTGSTEPSAASQGANDADDDVTTRDAPAADAPTSPQADAAPSAAPSPRVTVEDAVNAANTTGRADAVPRADAPDATQVDTPAAENMFAEDTNGDDALSDSTGIPEPETNLLETHPTDAETADDGEAELANLFRATQDDAPDPGASAPEAPAAEPEAPTPALDQQPAAPPQDAPSATPEPVPSLGFGARRGKVERPEGSGTLVGARTSRLGFGAEPAAKTPSVHPDTAAAPAPSANAPEVAPAGRLATQLTRVRDVSRAKPDRPADPPLTAKPAAEGPPVEDPNRPAFEAAPLTADPAAIVATARSKPDSAPEDTAFDDGLLARKRSSAQVGPSFRMGLILTLILVVLLAMIALWSVIFLPNSAVARLFNGGVTSDSVALDAAAPAPPAIITAPPPLGVLDASPSPDARAPAPDPAPGRTPTERPIVAAEVEPPAAPALPDTAADALDIAAAEALENAAPAPEAVTEAPLPAEPAEVAAEIPPLAPIPDGTLPSPEEAAQLFAEDGIWTRPPDRPEPGALDNDADIGIAAIDPPNANTDVAALPAPTEDFREQLPLVRSPPPFGSDPAREAIISIVPTPEGVVTPRGALVLAGRPAVVPPPRPREVVPATPAAVPDAAAEIAVPEVAAPEVAAPEIAAPEFTVPDINVEDAILGTFRPTPRPGDVNEARQQQVQDDEAPIDVTLVRPAARPGDTTETAGTAGQASLFPDATAPGETAAALAGAASLSPAVPAPDAEADADLSPLALSVSRVPPTRPASIVTVAAQRATEANIPAVPARVAAPQPNIPSNTEVSRAATEANAIRLRDVNLIGVSGTPSNRSALVRLPNGRFIEVGVGDNLDGGRVAAIDGDSLQYIKNGRNIVLDIPG